MFIHKKENKKVSKKVFFKPLSSSLSEPFTSDSFFFKMPSFTLQSEIQEENNEVKPPNQQAVGEVCLPEENPNIALKHAKKGEVQKLVEVLRSKKKMIHFKDENNSNILHYAAKYGQADVIAALFSNFYTGAAKLLNQTDNTDETALHLAVRYDQVESVKMLLAKRADQTLYNRKGFAAFHLAVECNSMNAFQVMINSKTNLEQRARNGMTALHIAAYHDNITAVKLLLANGAYQCAISNQGSRPLHVAAASGSKKTLGYFLEVCSRYGLTQEKILSYNDNEENTPLHSAVAGGNKDAIRICLEYGARLDVKDSSQSTPIHLLSAQGNLETIEFMFDIKKDQAIRTLSILDKEQHTPLQKAVMFNHTKIIAYLIRQGSDINKLDVDQRTPLLLAASRRNLDSVKILLTNNCDLYAKDKNGQNFLHLLVVQGSKNENQMNIIKSFRDILKKDDLMKLLSEADSIGCTPMHYTCEKGNLKNLTAFISLGISARHKTCKHQSALHFASIYGRYNACKKLLDSPQGPNIINEKDADGFTPLHLASMNGHHKVVQLLLNRGSNLYRTNTGQTAVHVATLNGFVKTVRVLISFYRRLIDQSDEDGNSPLHVASQKGHTVLVEALLDEGAMITINNHHLTAFVIAIFNMNSAVANTFILHRRWEEVMQTVITNDSRLINPSFLLVQYLPETFVNVLNNCLTTADCDKNSPKYWIRYDFKYLQPSPTLRLSLKDKMKQLSLKTHLDFDEIVKSSISNDENVKKQRSWKAYVTSNEAHIVKPLPVLNKMVDCNRVECLRHPVSREYLKQKWRAYGWLIHILHTTFYLMSLFPLSYIVLSIEKTPHLDSDGFIFNKPINSSLSTLDEVKFSNLQYTMMLLVFFVNIVELIKEICQVAHQKLNYFFDIGNMFEVQLYTSCLLYVTPFLFGKSYHFQFEIGAYAIFLAWFNMLFFMQKFDIYAVYVTMFLQIYKTLIKVILVFTSLIIAFSFCFHLLIGDETNGAFSNPLSAYLTMISILLGEIGWNDYFLTSLQDNKRETLHLETVTYVMMFFLMITIPILLMNLLIGLALGDIAEVKSNAELQGLSMEVRSNTSVEQYIPLKLLIRVDKQFRVFYPNSCSLKSSTPNRIRGFLFGKDYEKVSTLPFTSPNDSSLRDELHKQKQRIKDIQQTLNRQNDLLRLIVQKMEIVEEIEDQDEDYVPNNEARTQETIRQVNVAVNAFKGDA